MEDKQLLQVINQENLTLNKVLSILGFDDSFIKLSTENGEVEIVGKELKVTDLSKEKKTVLVEGKIRDVSFTDKTDKVKGFFGGKKV